jgi:hypothetical protein
MLFPNSAQRITWELLRSGGVAQTMYTHVSKCKIDEIKERKKPFTSAEGCSHRL